MIISSNLEKLKYDSNVLLEKDDTNNLDKDSILKTDRMYVLIKENIIFKIGEVSLENIEIYNKKLESIKENALYEIWKWKRFYRKRRVFNE